MSAKTMMTLGALLGALAVMIGAFGAHLLPTWLGNHGIEGEIIREREDTFETGARYHMYHALAMLVVGILQAKSASRLATSATIAFMIGIAAFSGNLYLYSVTGIKAFAMIVPLGGVSFVVGWILFALAAAKSTASRPSSSDTTR